MVHYKFMCFNLDVFQSATHTNFAAVEQFELNIPPDTWSSTPSLSVTTGKTPPEARYENSPQKAS
jgi:hypothetical protein